MIVPFGQNDAQLQLQAAAQELESCNNVTQRYGITLSQQDIQALVVGRLDALQETERVEFGGGVAKDLVLAFSSSVYVSQTGFVQTVLELQDLFYLFKNESEEQIPDDDLIRTMRSLYDDVAQGDMERLSEALLDGLARHVREVADVEDAADPGADDAVKNGYTLAAHRYDVSKWVDDEFAPAWDGASWMDE
ncbi:MAG: DUF6323 family protein [Coriobacteriia bacterium]|nr:DUF6323 family protein [Coriobacteriia bacterium]